MSNFRFSIYYEISYEVLYSSDNGNGMLRALSCAKRLVEDFQIFLLKAIWIISTYCSSISFLDLQEDGPQTLSKWQMVLGSTQGQGQVTSQA